MATDDLQKSQELGKEQSQQLSAPINDYDPDNKSETETKSLSSVKSNGSNPDLRYFFFFFFSPLYFIRFAFLFYSIAYFWIVLSFKFCFWLLFQHFFLLLLYFVCVS